MLAEAFKGGSKIFPGQKVLLYYEIPVNKIQYHIWVLHEH
jgi:hypothetical protein